MVLRSGALLGAAKACGVSQNGISAVKRTVLDLIRLSAFDAAEDQRSARELEQRARRTLAQSRTKGLGACRETIEAFKRGERN